MLSDAGHMQKAVEMQRRLGKFIRHAENSADIIYSKRDVEFAKELLKDIENAIGR